MQHCFPQHGAATGFLLFKTCILFNVKLLFARVASVRRVKAQNRKPRSCWGKTLPHDIPISDMSRCVLGLGPIELINHSRKCARLLDATC